MMKRMPDAFPSFASDFGLAGDMAALDMAAQHAGHESFPEDVRDQRLGPCVGRQMGSGTAIWPREGRLERVHDFPILR